MKTIDYAVYKKTRIDLIKQLEMGKLDKIGFINANLSLYQQRIVEESARVTCLNSGIFLYQYYNTYAKYHQMQYRKLKHTNTFEALRHRHRSDDYYEKKETVTYHLLKQITDQRVSAYYVRSNSKKLKQKLVEIVLLDEEKVVLHTLDQQVLQLLKANNWLEYDMRNSRIADYINTPYYDI